MMPQVDACIGTKLLGLAHTDNGRRDCRRGREADEPFCPAGQCAAVSKPTTGELTEAGFVSDQHEPHVRVRYATVLHSQRVLGCVLGVCFCYCVVLPFLSVALPRGKWMGAHP